MLRSIFSLPVLAGAALLSVIASVPSRACDGYGYGYRRTTVHTTYRRACPLARVFHRPAACGYTGVTVINEPVVRASADVQAGPGSYWIDQAVGRSVERSVNVE